MAAQTRVSRKPSREEMDELPGEDVKATSQSTNVVTVDVADDWLDSIDEALGEWAESDQQARDFVSAYQQKGGQ